MFIKVFLSCNTGNHFGLQDPYWCCLIQYCVMNDAYVGCDLPSLEQQFLTVTSFLNLKHVDKYIEFSLVLSPRSSLRSG